MSSWTYVIGAIEVSPMGRTQAEKEYVLKTVLAHLPRVSGSEEDMQIFINQELGYNSSSNTDEYENFSNLGTGHWKTFETQRNYLITVRGYFRDRHIDETIKDFMKWLCRLSKRVVVEDALVNVEGYNHTITISNKNKRFSDMYEWKDRWADYLLWDFDDVDEGKPANSIRCVLGRA